MKLLYVEDNPFDRDLTRRALLKQLPGLEWDAVDSVRDAIDRLENGSAYDVLLLDMWLPDGNGLDVLLHARRRGLDVAVAVVAGAGDEASVVRFLKAGAQDYLPKRGNYLDRLGERLLRARARLAETARPPLLLTALYVESTPADVDLTRRHFERRAPHIALAVQSDGPAALAWLETPGHHADVALIDLRLPGMSGLELLDTLRARHALPCILITGRGDEVAAAEAMRLGAVDYVVKEHGYVAALPSLVEHAHVLAAYAALQQACARQARPER
ncbi:MAG: response regulator [Thiobacillus sp.]|nr:response regulator [Thiobacillus sp.]